MYKKDTYLFGFLISLLLPTIVFLLLYLIQLTIKDIAGLARYFNISNLVLISIAMNLFPLRYYLVSLKYEKTGRGILIVTFLLGLGYFLFDIKEIFN